ncbi:hypothetical protein [Roseibium alexandrii]|uniref:Uncharacterized protein n=1 Tax=Roseibium alexandrii (strain DSM 17067 / NCIMB 14079 / DFL-11) TaxID=244592 RepID=A0A5E8GVB1_ROSAD|nr:hypothetical protein [Roseibium alexandrii]EEE42870.1 hypothetical protein SADFL11_PLAS42 [Roseibium alexandrii DFL-11]
MRHFKILLTASVMLVGAGTASVSASEGAWSPVQCEGAEILLKRFLGLPDGLSEGSGVHEGAEDLEWRIERLEGLQEVRGETLHEQELQRRMIRGNYLLGVQESCKEAL